VVFGCVDSGGGCSGFGGVDDIGSICSGLGSCWPKFALHLSTNQPCPAPN